MLPRTTRFHFFGGDLEGLSQAALDQGFTVSRTADDSLTVCTTDIVDELRFPDFDDLAHGWAQDFDAEYRGWDAGE